MCYSQILIYLPAKSTMLLVYVAYVNRFRVIIAKDSWNHILDIAKEMTQMCLYLLLLTCVFQVFCISNKTSLFLPEGHFCFVEILG